MGADPGLCVKEIIYIITKIDEATGISGTGRDWQWYMEELAVAILCQNYLLLEFLVTVKYPLEIL